VAALHGLAAPPGAPAGLEPWSRAQTDFGIGYALRPGSRSGAYNYWLVLIAPPPTGRLDLSLSRRRAAQTSRSRRSRGAGSARLAGLATCDTSRQ
jgi:hypothetical protein